MKFDKEEIDEIINDWWNDNYGLQIYDIFLFKNIYKPLYINFIILWELNII